MKQFLLLFKQVRLFQAEHLEKVRQEKAKLKGVAESAGDVGIDENTHPDDPRLQTNAVQ